MTVDGIDQSQSQHKMLVYSVSLFLLLTFLCCYCLHVLFTFMLAYCVKHLSLLEACLVSEDFGANKLKSKVKKGGHITELRQTLPSVVTYTYKD